MSLLFEDMKIGSIELFCLTAELHSFTAAAHASGLTPPAVSRSIARLETRLKAQLFVRTTRNVRLTDSGRTYYEQCKQALTQLAQAERALNGTQTTPSGKVRLSCPTSYGHYRILPLVNDFLTEFPHIELEIQLSNHNIDFTSDSFDLAIRGRTPPDSGLVARKLEDADLVVVASAKYLQQHGTPQTLEALKNHECIQFFLPSTGQTVPWLLRIQGKVTEYPTTGKISCTDDILGPITLAHNHAGLVQTYRFLVQEQLANERLVELFTAYAGASRPFSLMYPAQRNMPHRVRVFVDFLLTRLARDTPQHPHATR
jgi:DNA-binding transcriptional LysR family regulator